MATFVQIEPDAFNQTFGSTAADANILSEDGFITPATLANRYHNVRRPLRGIQIKDDSYATLQVRQSNGDVIPLFDAASATNTGKGKRNSNFILQNITEQRAEKQQIIMTFGEPYIFFFGEQPRMVTVSGVLLNTEDFNWRAEWWQNYDLYLRGTQCVRQKTRAYLSWDDIVVEGYFVSANAVDEPGNRNLVQFSFQLFLTNYQNISSIGDPNAHWDHKDIDLDPFSVSLPGSGGTSSTTSVRQANVQNALAAGQSSNSLLDTLRSGQMAQTAAQVVQLQGQAVDLLSLAGQFVSGRTIRVPVGFEGAAAFDQEVQVALASIPGSSAIINGSGNRTLTVQTGTQQFNAVLGPQFGPSRIMLPQSANEDEFIARIQQDDTGSNKFNNLFAGQTVGDQDAADVVANIFEQMGIDTSPPDEATQLFAHAGFGIVSVTAGAAIADTSILRSLSAVGTAI